MTHTGLITDPFLFSEALTDQRLGGSDTLWLRGGTYIGHWDVRVGGTPGGNLTLRAYPGESVRIDGSLFVRNSYLTLRDVEIFDSALMDRAHEPSPIYHGINSNNGALNLKAINCVIHDCAEGLFSTAPNLEMYGCVLYNNGFEFGGKSGHGVYVNTEIGLTLENNIVGNGFGYNIHAYNETRYTLANMHFSGNTSYQDGANSGNNYSCILAGGAQMGYPEYALIENNLTYYNPEVNRGAGIMLGIGAAGSYNCTVRNNYCVSGSASDYYSYAFKFAGDNWGLNTVENNTWIGPTLNDSYFPDNTFIANRPTTGIHIVVLPNKYEVGRANITIYNWASANGVTVDLSGVTGLNVGDSVTLHNSADYFADAPTLTLDGSKCISVDMRAVAHTVATPQGTSEPATTFPLFGAFVVRKELLS